MSEELKQALAAAEATWMATKKVRVKAAELSALRQLRDAVGKYIGTLCSDDVGTWSEVVAAYEEAKEVSDGGK